MVVPLLIILLCDILNIVRLSEYFLDNKLRKKWWSVTVFGYVFEANNLCSFIQNYDNMLVPFLQGHIEIFFEFFFRHYFSMRCSISINLFIYFFKPCFYEGIIVNRVDIRHFKVCITVCLYEHLLVLKIKEELIHCYKYLFMK